MTNIIFSVLKCSNNEEQSWNFKFAKEAPISTYSSLS